jgi:hypothetical protein
LIQYNQSYLNKNVVLTFSRLSGHTQIPYIIEKHIEKYDICVEHISRLYINTPTLSPCFHGQIYHKIGLCNTTIISSNKTQDGCRPFFHIANDINNYFTQARAVYLIIFVNTTDYI